MSHFPSITPTPTPIPTPTPGVEEDSSHLLGAAIAAGTTALAVGTTAYYFFKSFMRQQERQAPVREAPSVEAQIFAQIGRNIAIGLADRSAEALAGALGSLLARRHPAPPAAPVAAPVAAAAAAAAVVETPEQRAQALLDGANAQIHAIEGRINAATLAFNTAHAAAQTAATNAEALVFPTADALTAPIATIQDRLTAMQESFTTMNAECQAMIDLITQLEGQLPAQLPAVHAIREAFATLRTAAQTTRQIITERSNDMQASLARLNAAQVSIADQSTQLQEAINGFTLNIMSLSDFAMRRFIVENAARFPRISPAMIRERLNQALFARRESIEEAIAALRTDGGREANVADNRAAIQSLLTRLSSLRGSSGFNGTVNASWIRAFVSAQEEAKQAILVCKSHLGFPDSLSADELREIDAIHPQQEGSVDLLHAIAQRHKVALPEALRALPFATLASTRPEAIRARFDASARARDAAFTEYARQNAELESIGGHGFDPSTAYNSETRTYAVEEGSKIDYYQKAITQPARDANAKIAFFERLLREITPAAAAGGAGAAL